MASAVVSSMVSGRSKTEAELRHDLEELERQQQQIAERLRDAAPTRRRMPHRNGVRGGPGASGGVVGGWGSSNMQRGPMERSSGPGLLGSGSRSSVRRDEVAELQDQPPKKKRLLSAVVKPGGADVDGEKVQAAVEREEPLRRGAGDRWGAERGDGSKGRGGDPQDLQEPPHPLPRVLPPPADPTETKRNRRMFGALLMGTLAKFKEEDLKQQGSEAYVKRSEQLQRAEQRKREDSERLRQNERQNTVERQKKDLTLRARLASKAEKVGLDLTLMKWTKQHRQVSAFCCTKAHPPVLFRPAKPSEATKKLLEEQKEVFARWQEERTAELNSYCATLQNEYLATVDSEMKRLQTGAVPGGLFPRLPRAPIPVTVHAEEEEEGVGRRVGVKGGEGEEDKEEAAAMDEMENEDEANLNKMEDETKGFIPQEEEEEKRWVEEDLEGGEGEIMELEGGGEEGGGNGEKGDVDLLGDTRREDVAEEEGVGGESEKLVEERGEEVEMDGKGGGGGNET